MTQLHLLRPVVLLLACSLLLCAAQGATHASSRRLLAQRSLQQGQGWSGNWGQGGGGGGNRPQGSNWAQGWPQPTGQGWGPAGNGAQQQGGGNRPQGNNNNNNNDNNKGGGSNAAAGGAAGSGGAGAGGGGSNRPNPNRNKGDVNSLSRFTGQSQSFRNRPRQSIAPPTTGPASTLYQGFRRGGSAKANAQSLAETFNSNSEAAATAVASASSEGGASSSAVAQALAATSVAAPNVAPGLLAKSANLAVDRGQTAAFAGTMADAFSVAKRGSYVPEFTRSVTQAVAQGGDPARLAMGEAIATAVAQGGDSKAAVAEATATAFCEGGSTAQAWSSAYAVALSKDSQGCLVLNEAKAMAQAQCGAGATEAISKAEATSVVLGFCGLLDFIPGFDGFNFGTSQSGGTSWGGR